MAENSDNGWDGVGVKIHHKFLLHVHMLKLIGSGSHIETYRSVSCLKHNQDMPYTGSPDLLIHFQWLIPGFMTGV